jgi:peptidyl-prolyl cis-trans isomerase D
MLSRAARRYKDRNQKSTAEVLEQRHKSNPWLYGGSVVILIIIVVTFVGSPAVRNAQGASGGLVFGSYAGKEISYMPGNYFARQRELIGEQAQASGEATDNASVYYQIWRQAFQETVRHFAITMRGETARLYVSQDAVDGAVIRYGPYMENGAFSETRYRRASEADKFATRQLFREQLVQQQFLQDTISGVLSSKPEGEKLAAMASPERSFDLITMAFTAYPDDKVVEYGKANAAKFARMKVSRILVKSGKKEADAIKTRLASDPLRFEEIAKTSSKDSYAAGGGAMGWQYRYDLDLDFDKTDVVDKILALKQGEIGDPIEGKFGWLIYRCDEPTISIDMGLQEDRTTVRNYLERYEAGTVQDYTLQQAKAFVSKAREKGFAKAAAEDKLTVETTDYFPMNYQDVFVMKPVQVAPKTTTVSATTSASPASTALADALYSLDFFKAAFTVKKGEVTEPVVLGQAVVVLVLKDEREAPATEVQTMPDYYAYFEQQAVATDLETELVDSGKLVDTFDATYLRSVAPQTSTTSTGTGG